MHKFVGLCGTTLLVFQSKQTRKKYWVGIEGELLARRLLERAVGKVLLLEGHWGRGDMVVSCERAAMGLLWKSLGSLERVTGGGCLEWVGGSCCNRAAE